MTQPESQRIEAGAAGADSRLLSGQSVDDRRNAEEAQGQVHAEDHDDDPRVPHVASSLGSRPAALTRMRG